MQRIENRSTCYGYYVLAWADADVADKLIDWLVKGHVRDVVEQPGMIDAKVTVFSEPTAEGRVGVLCAYRLGSQQDLFDYLASAAKSRFDEEAKAFVGRITTSRWHGSEALCLTKVNETASEEVD